MKTGSTYIYARCPFYRNESEINEVRALIDKAELHTESQDVDALSKLSGNQEFMDKVYDELIQWMDAEIDENIRNYKKVYQN
jgi:predicted secreted protein